MKMRVHVVLIWVPLNLLVVLIRTRIVALMTMVDVKAKVANKVSWFDPIISPYS